MRVLLLPAIGRVTGLTAELFAGPHFWTADPTDCHGVTGRDLIKRLVGGAAVAARQSASEASR